MRVTFSLKNNIGLLKKLISSEYDECAPADWEDSYGDDCARHGEMDWCNPWPNYAKDGFNNMHCPECGCVEKAVTPSGNHLTVSVFGQLDPINLIIEQIRITNELLL